MDNDVANVDAAELAKFESAASRWWDPESEFKPLHEINPLRLDYIEARLGGLGGLRVADVGCGGGLLSEGMAARGARVTGVDLAKRSLAVARAHAMESGFEVDYRCTSAEALARELPGEFDAVTCLELLEHVPDPAGLLRACASLLRPGGSLLVSTINRNPKAYLLAVIGAEYVLRLLPKGTHDYQRFIRPSELSHWCRQAGLLARDLTGMTYNPLTRSFRLAPDVDVNYLAHFRRPAQGGEEPAAP